MANSGKDANMTMNTMLIPRRISRILLLLSEEDRGRLAQFVFDEIKHGDEHHQVWLRDTIETIFDVSIVK